MNLKNLAWVALMSAVATVGCGGDDEGDALPGEPGTPNKQAAASTTQAAITALQTAIKPASGGQSPGQQSANQLSSAAQATQNIVQPGEGAAPQGLAPMGLDFSLSPLDEGDGAAGTSGTCTCTESSCTFQACKMGGLTIDGAYSWGGGHIKCDALKYTFNSAATPGASVAMTIDLACDLTVTETSLDGMFHSKGHTSSSYGGYAVESDWDSKIEFKAVTFPSGGGAATGGTEHIEGTTTSTVNGQAKTYSAAFDVSFPAN